MSNLASKFSQICPKWDKCGTFFLDYLKLNLILKIPSFVQLGAKLIQFVAKTDIPLCVLWEVWVEVSWRRPQDWIVFKPCWGQANSLIVSLMWRGLICCCWTSWSVCDVRFVCCCKTKPCNMILMREITFGWQICIIVLLLSMLQKDYCTVFNSYHKRAFLCALFISSYDPELSHTCVAKSL